MQTASFNLKRNLFVATAEPRLQIISVETLDWILAQYVAAGTTYVSLLPSRLHSTPSPRRAEHVVDSSGWPTLFSAPRSSEVLARIPREGVIKLKVA